MFDISIFCPAIRTPNWDAMYDSICLSCKKYSFELILCGPFPLTDYLKTKDNVKMIHDLGSPSRCAQLCLFEINGKLCFHVVDDAIFLENAIDEAINYYESLAIKNKHNIINMKYREGKNYSGNSMRENYWMAWGHDSLRLPGIPQNYKISLHHLMDSSYFKELGGYDCSFVYQNFNLHDLMFRAQFNGAIISDSLTDVTTCDHEQKDHKVIEEIHQEHDFPLFLKLYSNPNILQERTKIDINNWALQPNIWTRRFKNGAPKTYEELLIG